MNRLRHSATDTLEGILEEKKRPYNRTWQGVVGGIVMFGFVILLVTWFPDERRHDLHLTHMKNHLPLSSPLYAVAPDQDLVIDVEVPNPRSKPLEGEYIEAIEVKMVVPMDSKSPWKRPA